MKRKTFLEIVGSTRPNFDAYKRNGTLPFALEDVEKEDGTGRKWTRYTVHEAAKMLAAFELSGSQGVTWSQAAAILREKPDMHCGSAMPFDVPGIHVARVEYRDDHGGPPKTGPQFQIMQGPVDKIARAALHRCEAMNGIYHFEKIEVASIVSVDLSFAYRVAWSRAKEIGAEWDADGTVEADSED